MKLFIKNIFSKFDASFSIKSAGWSAKKLTAFVVMVLVIVAHVCWIKHSYYKADYNLLPEVLVIDYGIVCLCLGMTTYEKIKIRKNEEQKSNQDDSLNTN